MIRSLRPGRLHRLGRGPYNPRPLALPCLYLSRAHSRSSSTTKRPLTLEEYKFICNYTNLSKSPVSLKSHNPNVWIPSLVSCLKSTQERQQPAASVRSTGAITQHAKDLDRGHALMSYLWLAKTWRGMDLLAHLGFKLKQWSTVHALLNELIDTYELLAPFMGVKNPAPNLEWFIADSGLSLNSLSSLKLSNSELKQVQLPASKLDLNVATRRPSVDNLGQRLLGSVLMNLGSLVLSAADHSATESKFAMSCVFRILARLHHLGLISDKVYQYQPADPDQISFRPPGLNLLSTHIMTVLSDAAWLEHETTLANTATEAGEEPPFLPFNVGFRELGPEIWLELILWCCVEHGFSKHGAYLLRDMSKRTDDRAWKFTSWAPLVRSLDTVRQTDISKEESWRHPDNDEPLRRFKNDKRPPFNGLGRRTISTEVVASIRDMLHNKTFVSLGTTGMSSSDLLDLTTSLTQLLEPTATNDELKPTNRSTNWNFNRMMESGSLIPNNDPIAFENVLRYTQNVVPPWGGQPIPTDKRLNDITKAQLYDETAAISGLIEYNVRSSSRTMQAATAFSGYARLQSIVDASKSYHIREFFEKFDQHDSPDFSFFESRQLDSSLGESSLPQIQSVTMAELLDLVTNCRAFDFGNWLLFNNDIDGPPIAKASYGDQALAPSILRFAAATQNQELSDEVIAALSPPLSTNTLKAVVNLHISLESWDRALFTLGFMRDYRAKSWGFSNITALAAKILRLHGSIQRKLASGFHSAEKEQESLARASALLVRLFQGEFSTSPSKSERVNKLQRLVLKRIWSLVDVLPGPLVDVLPSPLVDTLKQASADRASPRDKVVQIPINAFHDVLSAVVDVYGSKAGKKLFDECCLDVQTPAQVRTKAGGVVRLQTAAERKHHEVSGDRSFNAQWHEYHQSKLVIPKVSTFRILAQAAYREFKLDEAHANANQTSPFLSASPSRTSPLVTPHSLVNPSRRNGFQEKTLKDDPNSSAILPATESEAILDFCVSKFIQENMEESSIELELPGYMARMRFRGILGNESFHPP
ncbi:hypothetical protein N7509_008957 [Penicillium cosmopolitanum]|uniref:Uncharacterized protein n=1 Tax=Penicillium cosmopolitanum TaxID=1131564 RepID=A0A9W9VNI1_9EURO|nr:uncharacterized protein N7509_008957 [Penicillium cosmopolitanum]KAJ5386416.1 hypothetical protein N7509_008957 [Penicillium cosmopolitanum]